MSFTREQTRWDRRASGDHTNPQETRQFTNQVWKSLGSDLCLTKLPTQVLNPSPRGFHRSS